jgi:hypothetical protein
MKYAEKKNWRCSSFAVSGPVPRYWLFPTGILFCVPPEHENGFSFVECMKKSKTVDNIRNTSQAKCSTLSSESCKVFIQFGTLLILYLVNCEN